MSAARMGGEEVASCRKETISKQKQVTEELKEKAEKNHDSNCQVFLPEQTSWRIQTIKSDSEVFCYEKEISDYKESLYNNRDHKNFCGSDSEGNPVVISVATDTESKATQIILRDVRETKKESFENLDGSGEIKDASSVLNLARIVSPDLEIETLEEIECDDIKEWIALNDENYNELLLRKSYTFGVLYQRPKQSSESEIFGNVGHCEKFDHFLGLLGTLTTHGQDDQLCYYVNKAYQDFSLKFYVSTLLPHSTTNSQQLARKSRIGNCCVSIVFQGGEAIFSPEIITSQFLHVYVVVQPLAETDQYRVSVVSKIGVPNFGPELDSVEIINKENFDKFACKLINAVQASYKTGKLAELRKKYKLAGLSQITQKIEKWENTRHQEKEEVGWKCSLL